MTETDQPPRSDEPAAEGRGATVVVLNRDLMFGMRIRNALGPLGYAAAFAADTAAFAERLRGSDPAAALGLIDMNGPVDWELIGELATDAAVVTPLLAFGPHVDVAGRRAAKAAGVTRIVSNGDFHRDTVGLIRRYARATADHPGGDRAGG
jgi:hypothetical protein